MPPAGSKAPLDYLFALVVAVVVIGLTFLVEPATTRYIVLGVGVVMFLSVLAAAARPVR